MSEINLEKAVGWQDTDLPVSTTEPLRRSTAQRTACFTANQVSWLKRDLLLYAIGIGAKATDQTIVNGER